MRCIMTTYKELRAIFQHNYSLVLDIYTKGNFVRVDSDKIKADEYSDFIVKNLDLDDMAVTLYSPDIDPDDMC